MAHIDSLLKFIVQKEAQTGWLLSDAPSQFATRSGTQSGPTLTSAQIQALITEIAPEPARAALQETGATQFDHASPLGTFTIHVQRDGEGWQVAVSPHQTVPAPPQPTYAAPAQSVPAYGAATPQQGYYPPQGQQPHAYSQGGPAQGGYQQGSHPQGGYPQGGYPQGGYAQGAQGYGAPPSDPAPKSSRSALAVVGIIGAIGCGGFLLVSIIVTVLFGPVFSRARENAQRASCQSNLKQIGLATLQFTQDHQQRLPAGTSMSQWQTQLLPYTKSSTLFRCPAEPNADGYAVNPRLSAVSLAQLNAPERTVVMYEHKDRHLGGCNILFADGHVRWYRDAEADSLISAPIT